MIFSAEREQPAVLVLERQGRSAVTPPDVTFDVPIRLQFVHSTVASPVHCGVKRWRSPTLTMSGKLIVVFTSRRCTRGYCKRTVDFLVDAGTIANTDGRRRRRCQSDAGGKAVTPIVTRQFRKRPRWQATGRGDAMAEVGLGILNLHADADADQVVDAPGKARRGVIGLQVAASRRIFCDRPMWSENSPTGRTAN